MNIKDTILIENINGNKACAWLPFDNCHVDKITNTYIGYSKRETLNKFSEYILKTLKLNALASNGYINILDIYHGINDYILTDKSCNYLKLYYSKDDTYFVLNHVKYYLSEFFKA